MSHFDDFAIAVAIAITAIIATIAIFLKHESVEIYHWKKLDSNFVRRIGCFGQ